MTINEIWESKIKNNGADFVRFADASALPSDIAREYSCAVIFGKALSKEYIMAMKNDIEPQHKEVLNTERKMDNLSIKIAGLLEADGYKSVGKLKTGLLPHKTVALRAGLGFIGKNNLLITPEYGCAVMLGKVLTDAPFITESHPVLQPQCGNCNICTNACQSNALLGSRHGP